MTLFLRNQGQGYPVSDFLARVFQISVLIAGPLACYNQFTLAVEPASDYAAKPLAAGWIHPVNPAEIHPQLDLGGNLVDVLSAGSGGSNRSRLDRLRGDDDSLAHEDCLRHWS